MPRKGQTLDYLVDYAYPHQGAGKARKPDLDEAERLGAMIGGLGGDVTVSFAPKDGDAVVVAKFGPEVEHAVVRTPAEELACSCGRSTGQASEMDTHMERTGRCPYCWGAKEVPRRDGPVTECPACEGTGTSEDISYWGLDMNEYVRAADQVTPTS